jgi:hypothetical protein
MSTESPLKFPKAADQARLDKYQKYDKLYKGEHFDAFSIKLNGLNTYYARLRYIVCNFAGLQSRIMADMLFGETITVDVKDKDLQNFIDALQESNQLFNQLYESELVNSRDGDDVWKIRIDQRNPDVTDSPVEIIIEQVGPQYYFPTFDEKTGRNMTKEDVLVNIFPRTGEDGKEKWYLHKEIHTPGVIRNEVYVYNPNEKKIVSEANAEEFGFEDEEKTEVNRSLVFHVPNVRDGSEFFGTSDYADLETLLFALNNRMTKTDNILDKHSDPILAVPEGVLDENGNVAKEALGMFEMGEGGEKPEYIVWNANLDVAFKEVDKLVKFLYMFSEISPASVGDDEGKGGQADSGRALKYKMLSTLRKRNRKKRYYDQMIKDILVTAMELAKAHGVEMGGVKVSTVERPTIDWGSGLISDETEEVENATARIDAGLSSRADEIAKIDGVTPDEAQKKVKEIDKEATQDRPPAMVPPPTGNKNDPNNQGKPPAGE